MFEPDDMGPPITPRKDVLGDTNTTRDEQPEPHDQPFMQPVTQTGQGMPPMRVTAFGAPLNTTGLRPPWLPGQSGNPAGRKRTMEAVHAWITKLANEPCPLRPGYTWSQAAARAVYAMTIDKGNVAAAKLIFDRLDPPAPTNVTLNQFVVRADLNDRLDALKECDLDRLLPAEG